MLKILIIPENMRRGENVLDSIYKKETEKIVLKTRYYMTTENGTYYIIVRPDSKYLKGQRADQIILDYAFVSSLKEEVMSMLRMSCVPEQFQIIDDRNVLN